MKRVLEDLRSHEYLSRSLDEARALLARVEPELAPNYDAAKELTDKFGLGSLSRTSTLIEDIRKVLGKSAESR